MKHWDNLLLPNQVTAPRVLPFYLRAPVTRRDILAGEYAATRDIHARQAREYGLEEV
jgi:hypothetical protein